MQKPRPRISLIGLFGIAVFFYFSFDSALHTYDFKGKVIKLALALLGLILPVLIKCRREKRGT